MKTWILIAIVAVVFVAFLVQIYEWQTTSEDPGQQQPSPHAIDQDSGG